MVGCINVISQALPSFVIFNAKNLNLDWTKGGGFQELYMVSVKMGGLIWYFLKSGFFTIS